MTVVPASSLSRAEMLMLGNNIAPRARAERVDLSAVNRSLNAHGEGVDELVEAAAQCGEGWPGGPTAAGMTP